VAAVYSERMRFLHVPKTGGTWAVHAMIAGGIPLWEPEANAVTRNHPDLARTPEHAHLFTIAFVRHPLDWYRSFWLHRMREGWIYPDHAIDSRARSDDFNEFVEQVVENIPGHLGEFYERFVGPPGDEIDFIGRHEHLVDDLVRGLTLAGETFDERMVREHPPRNVGDHETYDATYRRSTARALVKAEAEVIARFYASRPGRRFSPSRVLAERRMLRDRQ
jgi:hypothetical protein